MEKSNFKYGYENIELVMNQNTRTENFNLDNSQVNQFEEIFSTLKGEPKTVRSTKGNIHVPYVVDFKVNQQNLKVFRKKINQNKGTVILLIDSSGSMSGSRIDQVRDLVANLYKGISEISRINLKVYTYAGSFEDPHTLAINEINSLADCEKITVQGGNIGSTPTHTAITHVTKLNENIKGKKIIITLTDGHPELYNHHNTLGLTGVLQLKTKRALVEAESRGFNIFGIGINLYNIPTFKNMFRDEFINVEDSSDIQKHLMNKLYDFVRSIRG